MNTTINEMRDGGDQAAAKEQRDRLVLGVVLVGMGGLFLLAQFVNLGVLVLPIQATAFLIAGIVTRGAGWFIPAGILGGLSAGIITSGALKAAGQDDGGAFLLCFAAGWLSITVLTKLFSGKAMLWPLIPGLIMGVIGGGVLAGQQGQQVLEIIFSVLGYAWPLALVVFGGALLLRNRNPR